jgi:S1-C subfamily serine protease
VIGINTAIATSTGDYNGICFALPSSEALLVYRQLVRDGHVTRGFLGALTERVTPQIAKIFRLPVPNGAIVSNVSEKMEVDGAVVESPAARAGLKARDVIIEFNGDRIRDDGDLVRKVAVTPVGTNAPLRIYRAGRELNLTVTIGRRPVRISPETDRARHDLANPANQTNPADPAVPR